MAGTGDWKASWLQFVSESARRAAHEHWLAEARAAVVEAYERDYHLCPVHLRWVADAQVVTLPRVAAIQNLQNLDLRERAVGGGTTPVRVLVDSYYRQADSISEEAVDGLLYTYAEMWKLLFLPGDEARAVWLFRSVHPQWSGSELRSAATYTGSLDVLPAYEAMLRHAVGEVLGASVRRYSHLLLELFAKALYNMHPNFDTWWVGFSEVLLLPEVTDALLEGQWRPMRSRLAASTLSGGTVRGVLQRASSLHEAHALLQWA